MNKTILTLSLVCITVGLSAQKKLEIPRSTKDWIGINIMSKLVEYRAIINPVLNVDSFFDYRDKNGRMDGHWSLNVKEINHGKIDNILPEPLRSWQNTPEPVLDIRRYPTDTSNTDLYLVKRTPKQYYQYGSKETFELDLYDKYYQYDSLYLIYHVPQSGGGVGCISGNLLTTVTFENIPFRVWPSQELSMRLAQFGVPFVDSFYKYNFNSPTSYANSRPEVQKDITDTTFWIIPHPFKELPEFLVRTNNVNKAFEKKISYIKWMDIFFFTNDHKYTGDTNRNNIYEYSLHFEWYGKDKYAEEGLRPNYKMFPQDYGETQPRLHLIGNRAYYYKYLRENVFYSTWWKKGETYFIGDKSVIAAPPKMPREKEYEEYKKYPVKVNNHE